MSSDSRPHSTGNKPTTPGSPKKEPIPPDSPKKESSPHSSPRSKPTFLSEIITPSPKTDTHSPKRVSKSPKGGFNESPRRKGDIELEAVQKKIDLFLSDCEI